MVVLALFVAGVIVVACGGVAAFNDQLWQAVALGLGGIYVVVWSAVRLIPAEPGGSY
jgi:hypothetical protein